VPLPLSVNVSPSKGNDGETVRLGGGTPVVVTRKFTGRPAIASSSEEVIDGSSLTSMVNVWKTGFAEALFEAARVS